MYCCEVNMNQVVLYIKTKTKYTVPLLIAYVLTKIVQVVGVILRTVFS